MTAQDYQNAYSQGLLPSQIKTTGSSSSTGGNFLGNMLSSLINPFVQSAKNIGGAAYEIPREIGLWANEGNVNNDIKQMQQTGDALKANPSAANIQATHNAGDQAQTDTNSMMGWKNAQNPFLTGQDYQQMQNNPGEYVGNQVKNSIGMMSYAVPFGKGANFLTKAVLPGMVAGGMQGISDPNASVGSVAADTAMGGVLPGATHALTSLLGLAPKATSAIADGMNSLGSSFGRSQYNLPVQLSEKLDFPSIYQHIVDTTGATSLPEQVNISHQVLSALGNVINQAAEKSPAVDLGGMNDMIKGILQAGYEIPDAKKQAIADIVKGGLGYSLDGKTDMVDANPIKVLQAIRDFEANGAKHAIAGQRTGSVEEEHKANAFGQIADAIRNRLYNGRDNSGGMNQALSQLLQENPKIAESIHAINPNIGFQFDKALQQPNSAQAVRHMMMPYVRTLEANNYAENKTVHNVISPWEFFATMGQLGGNPLHALGALGAYKALNSNKGKSTLGSMLMKARGVPNVPTLDPRLQNGVNATVAHFLPTLQGGSVQ